MPPLEKCFYCHKYIIPTHPEILKEKAYLESKRPVPWVRIYYVPDFVNSGIGRTCVGEIWTVPNATGRWSKWIGYREQNLRWDSALTATSSEMLK